MTIQDFEVTLSNDAGNKPDSFYRERLSPIRYSIRSRLLPYLSKETQLINKIQRRYRTSFLDIYFSWSANLAAHTFYVLILPIPLWLGYTSLARDLVWVLGLGIFISGLCKDYTCLPRPRSPPVHRITMSGYTAKEYGFPSSHSANATSVTLVFLNYFYSSLMNHSIVVNATILFIIAVYYFTLVFGRVYCGMHGLLDIVGGSIIGILVTVFRFKATKIWDPIILNAYNPPSSTVWSALILIATPCFIISVVAIAVYFHIDPVENCPCFEDSIAFIGVLMGLELSMFVFSRVSYFEASISEFSTESKANIPYSFQYFGIIKTLIRILLGMSLTLLWKVSSKIVLMRILPVIYDYLGIKLPINRIKHDLIDKHNENSVADFPSFVKSVANTTVVDTINNKIDYDGAYTTSANPNSNIPSCNINNGLIGQPSNINSHAENTVDPECQAFLPRFDVIIISRLIIYAGICTTVTFGFTLATRILGLDYNPNLK